MDLILATVITCSQTNAIIQRVIKNTSLNPQQKVEIVLELRKFIKNCPIVITK